ncbi:MAG TPA: thioredoxin family protein [Coleofasciculaceae cyanobacterium]
MSLIDKIGTPIGHYAPDFELPGIDGQVHHLSRYLEQWKVVGVIFLCNSCSSVLFYLDRLKRIQSEFQYQRVSLVGINANDASQSPDDSFENMRKFAREHQLNFPYLWDTTQDVARSFGVDQVPTAFLIDERGILRYSGRIDDNAEEPDAVQEPYLRNAIAALLSRNQVSPQSTEAMGNALKWRN